MPSTLSEQDAFALLSAAHRWVNDVHDPCYARAEGEPGDERADCGRVAPYALPGVGGWPICGACREKISKDFWIDPDDGETRHAYEVVRRDDPSVDPSFRASTEDTEAMLLLARLGR